MAADNPIQIRTCLLFSTATDDVRLGSGKAAANLTLETDDAFMKAFLRFLPANE